MSDFTFQFSAVTGYADMQIANGDFAIGDDLSTAVLVSIFSDRRATDAELDAYAVGTTKPTTNRGIWIDTYREDIQYGSGIWLLLRGKKLAETLSRVEEYAKESLDWMIADGVAETVTASAVFEGDRLLLTVTITRQSAEAVVASFDFAWEELTLNANIT